MDLVSLGRSGGSGGTGAMLGQLGRGWCGAQAARTDWIELARVAWVARAWLGWLGCGLGGLSAARAVQVDWTVLALLTDQGIATRVSHYIFKVSTSSELGRFGHGYYGSGGALTAWAAQMDWIELALAARGELRRSSEGSGLGGARRLRRIGWS